jgi:hypothetical protein
MIPLFNRMPEVAVPVMFPRRWDYIRTGLQINIERVQTFAQIYPVAVASSHFLIRLLMSLGIPMSVPLARYYDAVDARAKAAASVMNMTSSYAHGRVHEGIFYGAGCQEIILLDENYFDFMWVHDNWREACPITVLMHPKSDLNMLLPNGKSYSDEEGLVVVSINLAMLAVMYRAFTLEQTRKSDSLSPYQFVGGYVLPNMLASHVDVAVFNRFYRHAFDQHEPVIQTRHSFRMTSYGGYVDQAAEQVIENVTRQHRNFATTLRCMPAVSQLDMSQVMEMPDIFPTTQVDWALFAARTKVMRLLLKVCAPTALATDRGTLGRLTRAYAHNNVAGMAGQMLPDGAREEFFADMSAIEALLHN